MGKWIGYAVLVLVAIFVLKWALATLGGLANAIVPSGSGGAMTISPLLWIIIVVGLIVAGLWMLARGVAGGIACLIIAGLIWLLLMGGLQSLINNLHGIHWPAPTAGGIPPMGGAPSPSATPAPGTSAVPLSIPRLGPSPIAGIDWADILVGLLAIYLVIRIIRALFGGATATAPKPMSSGSKWFWGIIILVALWYSYAAFPGVRRGMNTLATTGNHTAGAILAPALSDKFNAYTGLYQRQGEWVVYKFELAEAPPAYGNLWFKFILPQTSVIRKFEVRVNGRIYLAEQMPFPGACQIQLKTGSLKNMTSVKVEIRGLNGWKIPAPMGLVTIYQQ